MSDTEFRVRFGNGLTFKPFLMEFDPLIHGDETKAAVNALLQAGYTLESITDGMINAQVTHNRGLRVIPTVRRPATPEDKLPKSNMVIGEYTDGFGIKHDVLLFTEGEFRRVFIGAGHLNELIPTKVGSFTDLSIYLDRKYKHLRKVADLK